MAEAAVEDRSAAHKFYCHACNVHFDIASDNFTCPHCSTGFIEELDMNTEHASTSGMGPPNSADGWDDDEIMITGLLDPVEHHLRSLSRNRRRRSGRRPSTRTTSTYYNAQVPLENILQDFMLNMSDSFNWAGVGNMQLFLNPADYAWGREGIDSIVTQLLNQMDGTGPPPVSKEVIDNLPVVPVNTEHVTAKLQCSVCWENFTLDESVKQLPCLHIYHDPCIRPWLVLHGTCPICRQYLYANNNPEQAKNNNNNSTHSDSNSLDTTNSNSSRTATAGPPLLIQMTDNNSGTTTLTEMNSTGSSNVNSSTISSGTNAETTEAPASNTAGGSVISDVLDVLRNYVLAMNDPYNIPGDPSHSQGHPAPSSDA